LAPAPVQSRAAGTERSSSKSNWTGENGRRLRCVDGVDLLTRRSKPF